MGQDWTKLRLRDAKWSSPDAAIAEIASRQNGRLSRAQLVAAGVTDTVIAHRVAIGQLIRLRHGLYAIAAHEGGTRARIRAALLSVGDDAAASHLSAAGRYRIRGDPLVVDVTCSRKLRPIDGVRLHRRRLDADEIRLLDGLPLTSPARTLFDLGTMLGSTAHAKAANEAFVLRLLTIEDLRAARARHSGRKGSAAFRRLLAVLDPEGREIRSGLEARLNAFLRARGFPAWESNVTFDLAGETILPDVLWRAQRVIVEADGRDPHLAPLTFASDRRRDRRLRVEGWEPVRVTWSDLGPGADELESDLRRLLGL